MLTIRTAQIVSLVHWIIALAMTVVGSLETAHVFGGSTVGGAILTGTGPLLIAVERYLSSGKVGGVVPSITATTSRPAAGVVATSPASAPAASTPAAPTA